MILFNINLSYYFYHHWNGHSGQINCFITRFPYFCGSRLTHINKFNFYELFKLKLRLRPAPMIGVWKHLEKKMSFNLLRTDNFLMSKRTKITQFSWSVIISINPCLFEGWIIITPPKKEIISNNQSKNKKFF